MRLQKVREVTICDFTKSGVNMNKKTTKLSVKNQLSLNSIRNKVYIIRGVQVMLDFDLAEIYGYEVRVLNQQVKRNIDRFPDDFMFQLNSNEIEFLRSQIVTSNFEIRFRSIET